LKGKPDKIDWRVLLMKHIGLFVDFLLCFNVVCCASDEKASVAS